MKVKRDTLPARTAARDSKARKRQAKKREIINKMCPEWCEPAPDIECLCSDSPPPNRVLLLDCLSMRRIAEELTCSEVETLTGKSHWQVTTVRNVFREEHEQLKQSKQQTTEESPVQGKKPSKGIVW